MANPTAPQGLGNFGPVDSSTVYDKGHGQAQMLQSSRSTSSLNLLPSMEGLEGRSSGQIPMRAGSPALGGQSFPKLPSWTPQTHDPFSDLVQQDLKRANSSHSNAGMS